MCKNTEKKKKKMSPETLTTSGTVLDVVTVQVLVDGFGLRCSKTQTPT